MNDHIDIGERKFSYRITASKDIDRQAQIFNETPRALSFFPSGEGEKTDSYVTIDVPQVILSSVRGNEMVLHNTSNRKTAAVMEISGISRILHFEPCELKTIRI